MTTENVAADQDDVDGEHDGSHPDAEAVLEPERLPHVVSKKAPDDVGQPQKLAVKILKNQRKAVLAPVGFAGLAYGASGRIGPERFVVSAAVVVAGEAEKAGYPENQQGRRERQEIRDTTMASGRTMACGESPKISGE